MVKCPEELRKHYRINKIIEAVIVAILLGFFVFAATGCRTLPPNPGVQVKTELENAVDQIKPEWLTRCPGLPPPPTENSVGALLADASESISIAAECAAKHNSFVDYFAPVVKKHKEGKK